LRSLRSRHSYRRRRSAAAFSSWTSPFITRPRQEQASGSGLHSLASLPLGPNQGDQPFDRGLIGVQPQDTAIGAGGLPQEITC
jgi:hypothetical protein